MSQFSPSTMWVPGSNLVGLSKGFKLTELSHLPENETGGCSLNHFTLRISGWGTSLLSFVS